MAWKFFTTSSIPAYRQAGSLLKKGEDSSNSVIPVPDRSRGQAAAGIHSFIIQNSKFIILAIFILLAGVAILRFVGLWWPLHYTYNLPRTKPPLEFMSPEIRFDRTRAGLKLLGEPIYFNFTLPSWYDQATVVLTLSGQTASPIYVGSYKSDGSLTLALWRAGFAGVETDGVAIPLDGAKREQKLQQIFIGAPDLKPADEIIVQKAEFYFKSKSHRTWLRKILQIFSF